MVHLIFIENIRQIINAEIIAAVVMDNNKRIRNLLDC